MGTTAKVSVAIGQAELGWARAQARAKGMSLSAVVTETLATQRRLEALGDLIDWMQRGQPAITKAELAAAARAMRSRKR